MAETPPKTDSGSANPLDEFLNAAEAFVKNVSAAILKAAGDHDDSMLIEGTSKVLIAQFASVCKEVRASYRSADATVREEVDHFLSIQQGALLARTGEQTATTALTRSVSKGFFGWLSQLVDFIKKLIRFIVGRIFKRVPDWLNELLELIDELVRLILSLLSDVLGFNMREVADDMSSLAVNTMNELAALARLKEASKDSVSESEE